MHVSVILFFIAFLLYYRKYVKIIYRIYKLSSDIPVAHGALPIIGHAVRTLKINEEKIYEFCVELSKESLEADGLCQMYIGPAVLFFFSDPEDALIVSNTCVDRNYMYNFAHSWLGDGLLTSKKKTWTRHRKLINPAFNQQVLDTFLFTFNYEAKELTDKIYGLIGKGFIDHWSLLAHYSLQAICQTAFGLAPHDKLVAADSYGTKVEALLSTCCKRALRIWCHFDFIYKRSALKKDELYYVNYLKKVSQTVLDAKKENNNNSDPNDNVPDKKDGRRFKAFMDLLLELENDGVLTEQEIQEEIDTMIVAGYDTTSSALMTIFSVLGWYTDVQERVYQEIRSIYEDSDREVAKDDLSKFVYTEAVIKEVMRLYPIVPYIGRQITKDVQIKNRVIPKGTGGFISIWGLHRNRKYWGEDADVFDPTRWLDPARVPSCSGAQAAFSLGRRSCIGKNYAYMSMKTVLAHTLRKFRIVKENDAMEIGFKVLTRPKKGHKIKFHLRQNYNLD